MDKGILLIGEPMGLFIARQQGPLEAVDDYGVAIAGAEYNVAVGMSRLGHRTSFITKLGKDPFGKRIACGIAANGIKTQGVQWSDTLGTGFMLKSKVVNGDPEVFYFRKGSAASTICADDVAQIDLLAFSHLHMTGILPALSPSCLEASRYLMERARGSGLFVSFDPNLRPVLWSDHVSMVTEINQLASLADLVMPGIGEGELLTGSRDPQQIADYYLTHGALAVVVKLGDKGAMLSTCNHTTVVEGYTASTVVDTVGAGDGFAVGILSALMEGMPLEDAVRRGNAIGAIQVMSIGDNDGLPTRQQLDSYIATGRKDW